MGSLGYSLMLEGQEGVTWPQWLAIARTCERLGFEALLTSDHYLSVVTTEEPGSNDAWTLLGAPLVPNWARVWAGMPDAAAQLLAAVHDGAAVPAGGAV